ncbi:hypothetical protein AAFO90_24175 [Phaeobacter sp. CAU 1743]|uniref:hypothetical protein n=1 Tax=Phaeobacter sp. CAU 1743 TaxID=3140367 RepID=UPI00325A4E74
MFPLKQLNMAAKKAIRRGAKVPLFMKPLTLTVSLAAFSLAYAENTHAADLAEDGRYDAVQIGGFILTLDDVKNLSDAGVLIFNDERRHFTINRDVANERQLYKRLEAIDLQDERAVRHMYRAHRVTLPGPTAHVLTIPSGFGPAVFANQTNHATLAASVGGVSRVPWTNDPDAGLGLGLGFGNSFEGLGVSMGVSLNDLSDLNNQDRTSFGFQISRYLFDGLSIGVGAENLFVKETDGEASPYIVASWAFDSVNAPFPFEGVLTVGVGGGRFAHKSPRDTAEGKGRYATALFGGLSFRTSNTTSVIADWNGRNLSLGASWRLSESPIAFKIGVRDLTNFSGDGPRLTGSVSVALAHF